MKNLKQWEEVWEDSFECNHALWDECRAGTNSIPELKAHRDFIEESYKNGVIYGHGDRAFQYMWKIIIETLPQDFSFLEIGIYKGQIISAIQLISNLLNKNPNIVGVTPLLDPDFAKYNRLPWITGLYNYFDLTMDNTTIHDGLSTMPEMVSKIGETGPYDVIYVDGDHSYNGAKWDIEQYGPFLKLGGYMVVDDASNYRKINNPKFIGIVDVSNAVRDTLEKDDRYKEVFTCFHNRVFRKIEQ